MPQDPNKRQQLYTALQSSGFQLPDYQKFDAGLNDANVRKQLYESLRQNNFTLPEFSVFDTQLSGQQPQEQPAGARVNQALNAWKQPFQQGMQQVQQGNPVAGGLRFAQGALQLPFAPIQVAAEGYRSVPVVGDYLAAPFDIAAAIPQFIGSAVKGGTNLLNNVFGSPEAQNAAIAKILGVSQGGVGKTANALGDVNQLAGAYAFTPSVARGIADVPGKIGGGLQKIAKNLETKAITPPFSAKKGLETFDRPVQTALKGNYGPSRGGLAKLENDLSSLTKRSREISSASAEKGTSINLTELVQPLDELLSKSDRSSAYYNETVEAVKDVKSRIGRVAAKYPDGNVPIDVANELKTSFQELANGKYDQDLKPSQIKIDLYKKVGYELLSKIVSEEPALRQIGLKQRDLIELRPTLQRKIAAGGTKQFLNFRTLHEIGLATGVGAVSGSPELGALTFAAEQAVTNPRALHGVAVAADRTGTAINPGASVKPLYSPYEMSNPTPEKFIPEFFRNKLINDMGGPKTPTRLGRLSELTDKELVEIAKDRGLYANAPLSEAPVSRGGDMNVRGAANAEQIRRSKK